MEILIYLGLEVGNWELGILDILENLLELSTKKKKRKKENL